MSLVTNFFLEKHPLLLRRKQFFAYRQAEGQDLLSVREDLRLLAEEADMETMNREQCLCLIYLLSVRDDILKEKFMAETPTLANFNRVLEGHAQSRMASRQSATASKVQPKQGSQSNLAPQRERKREQVSQEERARRNAYRGKCWRCGDAHMQSACKHPSTVKCNSCAATGHISSIGTGKQRFFLKFFYSTD